jgi:tRNA-2-methylthio-N6-dimethylallyladenosine synthase
VILYLLAKGSDFMLLPNYKDARKRTSLIVDKEYYNVDSSLKSLGNGKRYFIKTYGCQMNEHDTENIKAMLEQLGFYEVNDYLKADLVILNTCSIRENAHNKAFGMLGRLKHLREINPNLIVGLCGCMAQEEKVVNDIMSKYKWVSFVFGTHNIHRLPYILNESFSTKKQEIEVFSKEGNIVEGMPVKRASKYKAYVNIMYGCDKFCTYCIVPYTRGKQRSREKEDILKEVQQLKEAGYKEVTLLGQNVNAYGKDFPYSYNLENLLEDVSKKEILLKEYTQLVDIQECKSDFYLLIIYAHKLRGIVLDKETGFVKYNELIPDFIRFRLELNHLEQISFSKFNNCIERLHRR